MVVGAASVTASPQTTPESPVTVSPPLPTSSSEGRRTTAGYKTPWVQRRRTASPEEQCEDSAANGTGGSSPLASSATSTPEADEQIAGAQRRDVGTSARGAGQRGRRRPRRFVGGYIGGRGGTTYRGGGQGRDRRTASDSEDVPEDASHLEAGGDASKMFPRRGKRNTRGGGRGGYPTPYLYPYPGAADYQKMVFGGGRGGGTAMKKMMEEMPMMTFCPVHYPMVMPVAAGDARIRGGRGGRSFRGRRGGRGGGVRFDAGRDGGGATSSDAEEGKEKSPSSEEDGAKKEVDGATQRPPRRRRTKGDGDKKSALAPQDVEVFKKFTENFVANISAAQELLKKLEKVI